MRAGVAHVLGIQIAWEAQEWFWDRVDRWEWEPETFALLQARAAGKVVLDLGAWNGVTAIAAAKFGAKHVHAVEPDPVALAHLRRNIELNGGDDLAITVHPVALARQAGTARLASAELGNSMSRIGGDGEAVSVEGVDLAGLLARTGPIEFVKMDIEGAEAWALGQLARATPRPACFVSLHAKYLEPRDVDEVIFAAGLWAHCSADLARMKQDLLDGRPGLAMVLND